MLNSNQDRILIIDDNVAIHDDIRKALHPRGRPLFNTTKHALFEEPYKDLMPSNIKFTIDSAYQGDEAIKLVIESIKTYKPYAMAFVDIRMPPGLDGVETIKKLWHVDPDIQIVICTAFSDYSWTEMCKHLKYSDNFLILKKPFDIIEIRQFAFALTKKWRLNQQVRVYIENLEYLLKERSKDLEKSEQLLLHKSTHDTLTELPNRALLYDRTSQALVTAKNNNLYVTSYFIGINDFQLINDSYGFRIGDILLKNIADRLIKFIDANCMTLARWGGANFVIIQTQQTNTYDYSSYANQLLEIIKKPYMIENQGVTITSNIGISVYPLNANDTNTLLENSCTSLNVAKNNDRNNYQLFQNEFNKKALVHAQLENLLYGSTERNEFKCLYHPIIDINTNQVIGVESCLRWVCQHHTIMTPNTFLPIAEEIGMTTSIVEWMIKNTCDQINAWEKLGIPPLRVSIILNEKQFMISDFVTRVDEIITQAGSNPDLLEIELNECSFLNNHNDILQKMIELKNSGIHIALNDFGAGHFNLKNIHKFPIEKIKINKSYIQGINEKPEDEAIVRAMIAIAKNLNIDAVAEGVKTYGQINFLRHYTDVVKGYILLKPLDEASFVDFMNKNGRKKY